MQRDSDEDAWRSIVDNYGDRPALDDEPVVDPGPDLGEAQGHDTASNTGLARLFRPLPEPPRQDDTVEDELEEFVPPTPPPLPKLPPDRFLAWLGLFGSPAILLLCLVLDLRLLPWMAYLLVASFIGGFVFLVVKMPRSTDIDPWDDGARL